MTPACRVELVTPEAMPAYRQAWQALADRALEPTVFNEPAFLQAAVDHLVRPARLGFVAIHHPDGGTLIGLCAVVWPRLRAGFGTASAWSHPQATSAFPLFDRADAPRALDALLGALAAGGCCAFLVQGLQAGGPTARLLARLGDHAVREIEPRSRAVLLPNNASDGLPPKARKELRRQAHRLADSGTLDFVSARSAETLDAATDLFLDLEARGWKGRRGTALGAAPRTARFARAVVQGFASPGCCRFDSLTLDGRPIAMGLVLRSKDRAFFWKTAYDEAFARASPGLQLAVRLTAVQRGEPGLALTDSCAISGHTMIDRVWRDRVSVADCLVSAGPRARVPFTTIHTVERARRGARARVKSLYLALRRRLRR